MTAHAITLGGLELDVDNPTLYYDVTVDDPSTQFYLFDNTPNGADAYIQMGAVNGAIDAGLSRIDAPVRLNSNLDLNGLNLRMDGGITGYKGIISNLTGTLYLFNESSGSIPTDTFTGGVTINGGSVQINDDRELGAATAPLTLNGGTLINTGSVSSMSINRPITVTGNGVTGDGAFQPYYQTTMTLNGVISGSGSVTFASTGTAVLTGTNTYTGGTFLAGGGTVQISADANLGSTTTAAPVTFDAIYNPLDRPVLQVAGGGFSMHRGIVLDTPGAINVVGSQGLLAIYGQVSGPGSLTISGTGPTGAGYAGVIFETSPNSYSGGTYLNSGGNLYIGSDAELGTGPVYNDGGELFCVGFASLEHPLAGTMAVTTSVSSGNSFTFFGPISSNGVVKQGAGVLTLSNTLNTYGGITDIQAGTVQISDDRDLGAATTPVNFSGGNLEVTASTTSARPFTGQGTNSITVTLDSGVTLSNSGTVGGSGNSSALVVNGTGTLQLLNTANNYSGGTTINATLSVPADGSLGTSGAGITFGYSVPHPGIFAAGTLVTTANFTSSRAIALGAYGGTVSPAAGTNALFIGAISGGAANEPLVVNGTGTVALFATNAFAGGVSVLAGTLAVTGDGSLGAASGGISLNGGTLSWDGVGSSARSVTIGSSGGTIYVPQFDSLQLSSQINGTGTFTKAGPGTMVLNDPGFGPGGVTVAAGTLQEAATTQFNTCGLTVSAGGTFDLHGFNQQFTSLNGNGAVTLGGATLGLGVTASLGAPAGSGSFSGTITGTGSVSLYNDVTQTLASSQHLPGLSIAAGSTLVLSASAARSILVLPIPSISGTLDLTGEDLDVTTVGSLASITALVKQGYNAGSWTGTGITSSTSAGNSAHLTAIGVIQNNQSGTAIYTASNLFDGTVPGASDVLASYTYYGDTNLDGKVDGSDYSRIDSGYLTHATGWFNGDFNYDGVINGSDYTLIDNAYNTQGANLAGEIASGTAQIAGGASVPEPATMALLATSAAGFLGRRRPLAKGRPTR